MLNDTWRATTNIVSNNSNNYRCDNYWYGYGNLLEWQNWYLFVLQNTSVRMPDQCVQPYRCGTAAPLWLNGSHPSPDDGIVSRNVCISWLGNCCYPKPGDPIPPILVKACPGNYTVYKLVDPQWCQLAYCAGKPHLIH